MTRLSRQVILMTWWWLFFLFIFFFLKAFVALITCMALISKCDCPQTLWGQILKNIKYCGSIFVTCWHKHTNYNYSISVPLFIHSWSSFFFFLSFWWSDNSEDCWYCSFSMMKWNTVLKQLRQFWKQKSSSVIRLSHMNITV